MMNAESTVESGVASSPVKGVTRDTSSSLSPAQYDHVVNRTVRTHRHTGLYGHTDTSTACGQAPIARRSWGGPVSPAKTVDSRTPGLQFSRTPVLEYFSTPGLAAHCLIGFLRAFSVVAN